MICAHCGQDFSPKRVTQKFCSHKCYRKATNIRRRVRSESKVSQCPVCGKEFEAFNSKKTFCSKKCKMTAWYKKHGGHGDNPIVHEPKVCPQCGKSFVPNHGNRIFCSRECRLASFCHSPGQKTCIVCGKVFDAYNSKQKFCSKTCSNQARLKTLERAIEKVCPVCGKSFRTTSHAKIYCSRRCRIINGRVKRPAPPNKHRCTVCGKVFLSTKPNQQFCSMACKIFNRINQPKPFIDTVFTIDPTILTEAFAEPVPPKSPPTVDELLDKIFSVNKEKSV